MDFTAPAKTQPSTCLHCGDPIEQKAGAGRVKRFCTPWHGRLFRRATGFAL